MRMLVGFLTIRAEHVQSEDPKSFQTHADNRRTPLTTVSVDMVRLQETDL